MDPVVLPILSIQNDFQNVINEVRDGFVLSENIWLSCYKSDLPSVHEKVNVALNQQSRKLELIPGDGVTLESTSNDDYSASCKALSVPPTTIRVPKRTIQETDNSIKLKQVTSIAVAPDYSQIAIGYASGAVRRLSIDSRVTVTPLTYIPHLSGSAVTALGYFPSSRVLLTGGADFTLHVLNAELEFASSIAPKPVRSFKGHKRVVTGTAIIERGKNVLSSALDGTLRLWNVSNSQQIRLVASQNYSPINAIALVSTLESSSALSNLDLNSEQTTIEVGTGDKYVFLALENGNFECIELASGTSVFHSSSIPEYSKHGALTSLSVTQNSEFGYVCHLLATGSSKGVVTVYDISSVTSPVHKCSFKRNTASIEGLAFIPPSSSVGGSTSALGHAKSVDLAIATSDGLPYIAQIDLTSSGEANEPKVKVLAELAGGGDCEPNRTVFADSQGHVWVGGDDGVVRMY